MSRELRAEFNSDYEAGQFMFDFFNDGQLRDLAQSLGFDGTVSRQVSKEASDTGKVSFNLQVLSGETGSTGKVAESTIHGGSLATATLVEIMSALYRGQRLWAVPQDDVPKMAYVCELASRQHGWVIVSGFWQPTIDPLGLELHRNPAGHSEKERISLRVLLAGDRSSLTGSGRARFSLDQAIRADVLAQTESWSDEGQELVCIAHAVFARLGDPRFRWNEVSYPSGGHGFGL